AELLKNNGRRVLIENTDWRKMLALQAFCEERGNTPAYKAWVCQTRPLCQLSSLRQVLALDALARQAEAPRPAPVTPRPQPAAAAEPEVAPPVGAAPTAGPLLLGVTRGVTAAPVTIDPEELKQHATFLGAPGSGKTTAALTLIEQLLARGIPVVMLDRKGDLCRYADPSAWERPLADPRDAARRQRLRERLDVAVFTPGHADGRPLSIPIVPDGMESLSTLEREQLAGYAAAALGGMMGYKPRGADQSRQAILAKAIEVLGTTPGAAVTLLALRELVADQDPTLLSAVGGFDDRVYKKLADELLTLWHGRKSLLAGEADRLDIDALLGRHGQAPPGKTRLSVISTQFLGDAATVEFWVAQLLLAIDRWKAKNATPRLQAVFLFDEADLYLPAQRQPATKAPMEGLLKRARAAGVGLMLATQSPGDFDYKCRDNIRTWLVGRVKETTALNKLKPMFTEARVDVASKLPAQGTGQFHLVREKEARPVQAAPSLIVTEQLPEERILELARMTRESHPAGQSR
ncbi:MAG TPA: helicase HerA-like domain-containing protein, partial [Gemmataceae bacterium]|nr:helicase HerA-like domain-containing protein [Gemmataceae bacterium]